MVRVLTRDEINIDQKLVGELKKSVFIYPTDTIYGIGCDATNAGLVSRIREIKRRPEQPFSIIIPDKSLVSENCEVSSEGENWLKKLPGPYTLIFRVKKNFFSKLVIPMTDAIGVRIPNHWFSGVVKSMKIPIVTTSVNLSGEDFMTSLDDLTDEIKKKVDFIIYEGPIKGKPSTVVNLAKGELGVTVRG